MNLLNLPSLFAFQPRYYHGRQIRHYLPLLYDLVRTVRPKRIVVLGLGDGDGFFTLCQAVREGGLTSECVAVWRGLQSRDDDDAWRESVRYAAEHYREFARLHPNDTVALLDDCAERKVDLLVIDDCDVGSEILRDLENWERVLSNDSIVLVHGIGLQREDSPAAAWHRWLRERVAVDLEAGCGLGVFWPQHSHSADSPLFHGLTTPNESGISLRDLYGLAVQRIDAQAGSTQALADLAALSARQIWLESLLEDRWKAQETMDEQGAQLEALRFDLDALRRDRAKAQLVMDSQHEQLRQFLAEGESRKRDLAKLKAQLKEQKRIMQMAKKACRKGGRCFQEGTIGEKKRRPFAQRLARELGRIPRNLGLLRQEPAAPAVPKSLGQKKAPPEDRYLVWQREHEPDEIGLTKQRQAASQWQNAPLISLLLPVYDPPAKFLDALLASIAAQTAPNWELCLVDGGSQRVETRQLIEKWMSQEKRIRHQRLTSNLGISLNTNHALAMATGDFIACVDHDDLLASWAIYSLTRAIERAPEVDIFYSDEDRCDENGRRHTPFFKPEWSPELLCSSMYLGHLTAYRRALVEQIGDFRREFDLSQDYDFALRATEKARAVHHIPQVLYHWREHPASGSSGGKPEARVTNLAALADAMKRRQLPAEIIEYPTANRARLQPEQWPRVSIIIPTDSSGRAQRCLENLPNETDYPNLEIVIVTNSGLLAQLQAASDREDLVFVPYDEPFNFSDKCNAGARAASGERFIFFNDDVETAQRDWIQNLIEPLENPEIGAVAPKLLYENGQIQHAGLVVGVRNLVGTAFHQRPADSTEHFNFAQSLRDVSALSAACLALRREDFFRIEGFDAMNTPIAHSDVDLCFKIRAAGLRCVYTPFATLHHAGHVSLGATEERPTERDKASIYLLKRWPEFTTHDPYFPTNMRDWLYTDSPTPIRMAARGTNAVASTPDLLLVSHDFSLSGAPIMLWHAARWCRENGIFAVVMSPNDGPLRKKFSELGIPVIIDSLLDAGHESFLRFARDFDCVIANSIRSKNAVRALKNMSVPVVWWVHEPGSVGEHYLREDAELRAAMPLPDLVIAPSERTAEIYRAYRTGPVKALHNAIPDLEVTDPSAVRQGRLRFLLLASIEPRKGQDIFVEAAASLPAAVREKAEFQIAGRILDPDFWLKVDRLARSLQNLSVLGALAHQDAIAQMREADVIVSASRDEAMPVIILEALSLGRALIATTVGGISEILTNNEDALLVRPESSAELALAMRRLIENPSLIPQLAEHARTTYERRFTLARFGKDFRRLVQEAIDLSVIKQRVKHEVE